MRAQESHYILDDAADAHDGETMRQRFKPASQAHSTSLKSPSESSNSHNRSSRPTKRGKLPPRRGQARDGLSHGILRRSWAPPLVLVLFFLCLYAINPSESNAVSHFLFLSYRIDSHDDSGSTRAPAQYGKGPWDIAFVCFYTIFLSFTREFTMQEVLRRLAHACGIRSRAKQSRFMEQMYTACYVAFIGPLGLYVMKRTPGLWYFETRGMYESYPHRTHGAVFKFYYLFQAAFWAQQVLVMVLGQEKRRKDFKEFVAHHMVTVSLIWLSYRFHFTYAGIAIYITHDISDFFLAVSQTLQKLSDGRTDVANAHLATLDIDFKVAELHRPPSSSIYLRPLHRCMDLPAPLHQPDCPLLRRYRVLYHRSV